MVILPSAAGEAAAAAARGESPPTEQQRAAVNTNGLAAARLVFKLQSQQLVAGMAAAAAVAGMQLTALSPAASLPGAQQTKVRVRRSGGWQRGRLGYK